MKNDKGLTTAIHDEIINGLNGTIDSMSETNRALLGKLDTFKKKLDNKDAQISKLIEKVETMEKCIQLKELFTDSYWAYITMDTQPIDFIKSVHFFNNKTTVVYWRDDTKTVVVTQDGDTFNKELGLAMAISKKFFGNTGNFNEVFKKYCYEEE